MNTAVNRLIWQEYRSQRAIWLVVFVAVCLLLFMVRVNTEPVPLEYSTLVAIFGGAAFAVLSFTVSFSGEVDNKTDVFLRMLPCSTSDLITARLIGTAIGAILFVPAMIFWNCLLEVILIGFSLVWPDVIRFKTGSSYINGMSSTIGEDLAIALAVSYTVVSIVVTCSLLSRKVFTTILVASALVIVIANLVFLVAHFMMGANRTPGLSAIQLAPWYAGTGIVFTVIALSLSAPWHLGKVPFTFRWRSGQSSENASSARSRWMPSSLMSARLICLAARPESRSRVMQTLASKELRTVSVFLPLAVLTLIGCYAIDLYSTSPPTLMILVPLVFCFECGQRSLRDDQRSGTLRTLASMGLSPGTIWMAKTVVWLGTAASAITSILFLDFLFAWWIQVPSNRSLWTSGTVPKLVDFAGTLYLDVVSAYGIASIVAAFSIGQLSAAWVERQVLAFAVGMLSTLFGFVVGAMFLNFGWSLWLTAVPMSLVLLTVSSWTSTEWVEGRWSLRIALWRMGMLVVPLVVFSALGWSWWRYEPQWTMNRLKGLPEFNQSGYRPQEKLIYQRDLSFWKEVTSAADGDSPWKKFSRLLLSEESVLLSAARQDNRWVYRPFAGPESAEDIVMLLEPFGDLVSNSADAWPDLPVEMTAPWEESLIPLAIVGVLIEDARLKTAAGQFQDAGQRLILAVQLARRISQQASSWGQWQTCLLVEQRALDHLRSLTNAHAAELDLAKLYEALKEAVLVKFDSDRQPIILFPDPRPMLHLRTLYAGLLYGIDSNEDYRKAVISRFPRRDHLDTAHWASGIHGSDLGRQADLMAYSEKLVRMRLNDFPIGGDMFFGGGSTPNVEIHHKNLDRLLNRSALWDLGTDVEVLHRIAASNSAITAMAACIANERATLLTFLLQQHRKENGSFPATLFDLKIDPISERLVRIDPCTGESFFYAPAGISKPVLLTLIERDPTRKLWAPKNQPLLASAGIYGGRTLDLATIPPKDELDPSKWRFVKLPEGSIMTLISSQTEDETLRDLPTFP